MNLQQRIQVRIQQLECIEYSPRGSGEYAWHSSIAEDLKTLQSQNDRLVRALRGLLLSADASWMTGEQGHDWSEAVKEAEKLI